VERNHLLVVAHGSLDEVEVRRTRLERQRVEAVVEPLLVERQEAVAEGCSAVLQAG
jgi:hypothetical protein